MIINSDFFFAFSPLQNIVIIILRPVLSKNKKTKIKKGNKGFQEIIGLIPFGKKMQDNCHASKCCGVMSPHRKKHQTHFLFIFLFFFFYCAYCTLLRVEWRASSLPGFPPTFEQARVLRTRLEKAGFHRDNLRI